MSLLKKYYSCVFWACASCLFFAQSASAETLLGIFYGNQGWKMEQVRALENWQGKRHALVNLFTDWTNSNKVMDNLFNQQLPNIWNNRNVPMITWEPSTGSSTPTDIEVKIANGDFDAYVTTWLGRLKSFLSGPDGLYGSSDDRRVYVILAHEMNGDWYPWSAAVGNNSPLDYVDMWQRVHDVAESIGLDTDHLQWIWCVNADDFGPYAAEDYYPGDNYVDWIAIDGYNWGASQSWSSWQNPPLIYDDMLARVRALPTAPKPVALPEFASTSAGEGIAGKSAWIADAFNYALVNDIKLLSWFNLDKETDWGIFGGGYGDSTFKYSKTTYKAYSAYKAAVAAPEFVPSDPTNPRLISDLQFFGQ